MPVYSSQFGITKQGDEVTHFTLTNSNGYEVEVINYGCTIVALRVPDRNGELANIVLSYETLEDYENAKHYAGAIIGRYANRIKEGQFRLGANRYQVSKNENGNHLHGGFRGFDKVIWRSAVIENEEGCGIDFQYFSPAGEEGYPGNLSVMVRYFLTEDSLQFIYAATCDADSIINMTQHTYFNLNAGGNILTHHLKINADRFLPIDNQLMPTGEITPVQDTPFDFRDFQKKGKQIHDNDNQLRIANGYDHCFVLNKTNNELSHAATLFADYSGRKMEVYTTEPGIQLYTGNGLDVNPSANFNGPYSALCLETQHFPESLNNPEFPSGILLQGQVYQSKTVLKFSID